jgi:hypothetical protein
MSTTAGRFGRFGRAGARADGAEPGTARAAARALTPAELAWLALIPCALLALAALVALGPPLGDAIVRSDPDPLWPVNWWTTVGEPQPLQQGRSAIALLAPVALAAAILWGARRAPRLSRRAVQTITLVSQSLVVALVVLAVLGQRNAVLADPFRPLPPIFGVRAFAVAGLLVAVALVALRRTWLADALARLSRDTTAGAVVCFGVAALVAASCMLVEVQTDRLTEDFGQLNWTLNDVFAVLNGRTPLVDYHMIYGRLVPVIAAPVLAALGTTALVYTTLMAGLSVLALLCVYAIFRRLSGSSLLALGLFVPFLALTGVGRTTTLPALWPMRYGGVYLLAWLTARHVARGDARHVWALFAVGGLVMLNNLEFGLGAVLATLVALLCGGRPHGGRELLRLTAHVVGGLLLAGVLVSAFTLLRAGALPSTTIVLEWPRIFTNLGWFALPMPAAGLHLALYATFVAAVAVAAVRVARGARDVPLTSMVAWAGVFGLVAALYYVGRPDDSRLYSMLSTWAFALMLLTIVTVRELARRGWRGVQLAHLLVLFGFALAVCSIARISLPAAELDRLTAAAPDPVYRALAERFVRERTRRGDAVVILLPEGYRIAHDLGLRNVAPYGMQNAVVTRGQMQRVIDVARAEGATRIFVPATGSRIAGEGDTAPEQVLMFGGAGFPLRSSANGFAELGGPGEQR